MVLDAYRAHRGSLLVAAGLLAGLGAVLLASALLGRGADDAAQYFTPPLYSLTGWLQLVPLAIGLAWGVPLLGEASDPPDGVSPARWLRARLGLLGAATAITGAVLGAVVSGWLAAFPAFERVGRFGEDSPFAMTGVAAIAWCLVGFAVGVAAGALTRGVVRGGVITAVVLVLAPFGMVFARHGYADPTSVTVGLDEPQPDGYIVDARASGTGERAVFEVHLPDRYWLFQWIESGLLLAVAAALIGLALLVARPESTGRRPAAPLGSAG